MFQFHKKYFALTILLFLTETVIALFVHDSFFRPHFGDFLVVILLYCFLKSFLNISVQRAANLVLLFAFSIEITQYFHLIKKLDWQDSTFAKAVLGNSFSWMDFITYVLGIVFVIGIEKKVRNIKPQAKS